MATARATITPAGHPRLRITTQSGRVRVFAEEREDILFECRRACIEDVLVSPGGEISPELDRASRDIDVYCPAGTDLVVGTQSGNVELDGEFGRVSIATQSGKIDVDHAEMADLRSGSGNISIEACGDRCRVSTRSGKAIIGPSGPAEVDTVSGSILLEGAAGNVRAKSASGKVEVRTTGKHDIAVETLSGEVLVRVPGDVRPAATLKSLSGRRTFDCEEGADCCVAVRTMSGSIDVVPD